MKLIKKITSALLFIITISSFAQQGINYKALIKDGSGNVLASAPVSIQFIIYEGAALTNNVYQESHTINTDANGMVIVNISEGTTSDVFADIDWVVDEHFLNVQVNTGSGLTDLGTTQFMAVPYALSAANVTGLETLDEGNGNGRRLIGQNPNNYGDIGEYAVDLSYSDSFSTTRGASGNYSTAIGVNTIASEHASTAIGSYTRAYGNTSTAMGNFSKASGDISTAMGFDTDASGFLSTAMGYRTTATYNVTALGRFNIGAGDNDSWIETDPLVEVGNGVDDANRSNALTILKNGTITAPSFDLAEITDDKALITKEYLEVNGASGLEALNEGNGNGWRLVGRNPDRYGDIGYNAVDLMRTNIFSTTKGATGDYSTAMGNRTTASGDYSTAMGSNTTASGDNSTAMVRNTTASGDNSTALGYYTIASGFSSTAMGNNTTATYSVTALGRYNIGSGSNSSWIDTDPLFEIGNGTSDANRSNALTVFKDGTVGIGTSSPDARVGINTDAGEDAFRARVNGTTKFKVDANGAVSTYNATTSATFALNIQNNATNLLGRGRAYSWNTYSDRRIKSSIRDINYGLNTILKLRPTAYNHHNTLTDEKSGATRLSSESAPDIGLIAQEVYKLVPEAVSKPASDDDLWSMDYTRLVPVLIKAIQEQQEIIESQNNSLKSQRSEINLLNSELVKTQESQKSIFDRLKQLETSFKNEQQ